MTFLSPSDLVCKMGIISVSRPLLAASELLVGPDRRDGGGRGRGVTLWHRQAGLRQSQGCLIKGGGSLAK